MTMQGASVILGVSGSVAAYKAAALCSDLVQRGATVEVVLTEGAAHFVGAATFNALTRRPVHDDPWEPWTPTAAGHVSLAANADLLVVAPASANTLFRLAHGAAPDLLGMIALATQAPLVIAPAMEHHMWHHPATRANIEILRQRGATIVGPASGRLASGASGDGRLAPVEDILAAIETRLSSSTELSGCTIVVTAGGTHEPLDPVRFIGNRSSGQMGYALAAALRDLGASVTLISGPATAVPPAGVSLVKVETALEMEHAVQDAVQDADALVMAAAVADFRPETTAHEKIKKTPGQTDFILRLVRNPDILANTNRPGLIKIGFAAETNDLLENARRKLVDKQLDLLIANDAVATIGQPDSEATLISRNAPPESLPRMDKIAVARVIAERIARLLRARTSHELGS